MAATEEKRKNNLELRFAGLLGGSKTHRCKLQSFV
jgi:hypothetical protein